MVNYKNAKIYKLVNDSLGLTYFGSTCGQLRSRLCAHKSHSKTGKCTSKLLFELGSICKIYLVEEFPTDNKMLLHQRERWYIENNDCVNKCLPGRTTKEYYVANKEHISKQQKEWEVENHNKRAKQKKIYRANNAEKIKEQKKLYYQNNADKIKARNDLYYQKNKDKINAQNFLYRAKKKLEQSLEPN
jgi:hypothetical protein